MLPFSLTARPMPPVSLERVVSPNPAVESVKSNDSDKTLSGSSDSIGTAYRMDSQVYPYLQCHQDVYDDNIDHMMAGLHDIS